MNKHPQPKNAHLYNNCPEQPIDVQKLTKEIIKAEAELRAMGNKPKSETEQPTNSSPTTKENLTPVIEPKTDGAKGKDVSQLPEQPNTELLIVKTIHGLMACVNDNLDKLCVLGSDTDKRKALLKQALEDIDLFEKTALYELQKAFE